MHISASHEALTHHGHRLLPDLSSGMRTSVQYEEKQKPVEASNVGKAGALCVRCILIFNWHRNSLGLDLKTPMEGVRVQSNLKSSDRGEGVVSEEEEQFQRRRSSVRGEEALEKEEQCQRRSSVG